MSDWKTIKRAFREALINAHNWNTLAMVLQYHCDRRLDLITAKSDGFTKNVDDVLADAERNGWLETLAQGALAENERHTGLKATVSQIVAGVAEEGKAYYQGAPNDQDDMPLESLYAQLHPYLETLQRRTYAVPLAGLDESGEKGGELALNRVFVSLNAGERPVQLEAGGTGKLTAAIGHLHTERQLILLGDPGSGKSTLLRYVAHSLAGAVSRPSEKKWPEQLSWPVYAKNEIVETRQWKDEAPVPIFVVLRDFARQPFDPQDGRAIVNYVCDQLRRDDLGEAAEPLRRLAKQGQVLFLLDGADEVPAGERAAIWKALAALDKGAYGGNRWVATCRVLSFDREEAPAGVPVQTLQALDEAQIVEFIDNWYGGLVEGGQLEREQALDKAQALKLASQRETLRELAQNPMLLTIMALVQTFRGTLPDERVRLYKACVETLLLRWQLRLETGEGEMPDALSELGTTSENLQRLLWEIAWQAHSEAMAREEGADIKESEIMALAARRLGGYDKAEQFLAYTEQRAHLLVGRGGLGERVYSFPHRTFQEYLAACYLTPGMRLLKEAPRLAGAGDTWREVLNLAAGVLVYNNNNFEQVLFAVERMVPHAAPAASDGAAWYRVWLAGEMAAVVGRKNFEESDFAAELLPLLRARLVHLLEYEALTPQQRAEAGDTLGELGDPRTGVCTLEPELIKIPVGKFIYQDGTHTIKRPFAIARYPVTVAQFAMFVEDGGYEEARYWGGEESAGWRWRVTDHPGYRGEGPVTQPRYWQQPLWHEENRPVIGVSWYEAMAYCAWLAEKSGRKYRLPSEEDWERAARHTDGREYSWGNEWEDGIINSREARINRTSSVGAFPRGAAECGAYDMSGNVWEWTASFYDKSQNSYVVRGGSWGFNRGFARVALRFRVAPDYSILRFGFRLVSPVS